MRLGTVTTSCLTLCDPVDRSIPGPSLLRGLLVCSNSCPVSRRWYINILPSAAPFTDCLQTFPTSKPFPMSLLFTSSGQSIRASASATVLPTNIQGWFPLGWTGWLSLQSKGLSRVFSNTTVQKHQFLSAQVWLWPKSVHD